MRLDTEQEAIINCNESAAVIAGPGSGKTFTLIEKAKAELRKGYSVLALAFTRAAAQEIRARAAIQASTIHSLCYHTINKPNLPDEQYDGLLDEFYRLTNKPSFDVVLVDEYQDLNVNEMKVVLSTVKPDGRLYFFGDPQQSIFGYTDATGSEIASTKIKKLRLLMNYRSSETVVGLTEMIYKRGLISVNKKGNPKVSGTAILFRENSQMDAVALDLMQRGFSFQIRKRGKKYPGEVIGYPPKSMKLVLSTIHCAKGKQWKNVICFDWGMKDIEKNLFYVAASRASANFDLVNDIQVAVKKLDGVYVG